MTQRQRHRAPSARQLAGIAVTGTVIGLSALASAGVAMADPTDPSVPPVPGAPGVPVADAPGADPVGPPPPAPGGPPMVPEVAPDQAHYGSGSGPLGFLRDAWHQAKDPYNMADSPDGGLPMGAPPPGAGPAPALPPGYKSLNAPGSETASPAAAGGGQPYSGGPALPPGYYPLTGPPPPGYFDRPAPGSVAPPPGADPAAQVIPVPNDAPPP